MITAELTHNPYLLHTVVHFNGQLPRINSQVEKYELCTLRDWVEKIPDIFHDEMNGYDFDLYFTGTKADFECLQSVFRSAGVTEDMVRLIHKNELEGTETKSHEIDVLMRWLKETPNRKFEFESFYAEHGELFESLYPYIVINGRTTTEVHPEVGVEEIKDSSELQNTVLTNTPILFCVDPYTRKQSREDLKRILRRSDVKHNQIFFWVHPQLDTDQVKRIIIDLGIEKPQIVDAYGADQVLSYIRNYPMAEFVREAIIIFDKITENLTVTLDEENQRSAIQNAEVYAKIGRIADQISLLKATDNHFTERDNFREGYAFYSLRDELESQVTKWRNRKTKVVGDAEIALAAREYDTELARFVVNFIAEAKSTYLKLGRSISDAFRDQYKEQGLDLGYAPVEITLTEVALCQSISMADKFVASTEITYEEAKKDFMSLFRFSDTPEEKEPVRVATCYYAKWREIAWKCIQPIVNAFIEQNIDQLRDYYNALAEAYHTHLTDLLTEQEQYKDEVSAQLSDDERKLQEDNDWLAEFKDQLIHIKRD